MRFQRLAVYYLGALVGTIIPAMAADNFDHHTRVDIGVYPWSSVGKIYNSSGGACTGTLVGPKRVLTAAHCIFNPRTRRFIRPELIHVLLGYDGGHYQTQLIVAHYEIGPGYDGPTRAGSTKSDWAVLTTATSAGDQFRPIDLADGPPVKNASVMLPGFAQDHAFVVTADMHCQIVGTYEGASLIASDCVALHGDSGAPLITADDEGNFHVVGVQTAIAQFGGIVRSISVASTSPGLREAVSHR